VRLLIAEDEISITDAVARGLRREGMAVDVALDGREALYGAADGRTGRAANAAVARSRRRP
jgi:DNA-binding response OmpR family regulator